ncbi:helix-turn-helix domain-containing protein [Streptomyces lycii]|uniref:Helix-turn-helix domain-containing protein n=1 Tax=Streptomyces lycii TaxID=2654337 RepID=A0ABQ7FPV9_9ACTN|nr:helix-turn-helix transcriptional regulator [Streptomyces lycii]KAF4410966.1 helix-turn-helix domain-containing protein [Streptomyces lycii]
MVEKNASSGTLRYFGSQMRLWRQRAGMSRERLAEELGYSVETISSVEQGRRIPQPSVIEAMDDVLGAGGLLKGGAPFLVREKYPDWFQDYARYEAQAVWLDIYENHVIPGLLQTEDYARAVFRSSSPPLDDAEIERRVESRLSRQSLLNRAPTAALGFVIEAVALHRPIGGASVMRQQLSKLVECAELRNVAIQIMPTERESHAGLAGAMYLLETPEQQQLAYTEGQGDCSFLVSDRKMVSELRQRYGTIRAQALTPEDSMSLLERLLGEQ